MGIGRLIVGGKAGDGLGVGIGVGLGVGIGVGLAIGVGVGLDVGVGVGVGVGAGVVFDSRLSNSPRVGNSGCNSWRCRQLRS